MTIPIKVFCAKFADRPILADQRQPSDHPVAAELYFPDQN